jgi:hypothetical protein
VSKFVPKAGEIVIVKMGVKADVHEGGLAVQVEPGQEQKD